MAGVAHPLVPGDDALEDLAVTANGIHNALDLRLGHDAVGAPGLVRLLVDGASEDGDKLVTCGSLLLEGGSESFSLSEFGHHTCSNITF